MTVILKAMAQFGPGYLKIQHDSLNCPETYFIKKKRDLEHTSQPYMDILGKSPESDSKLSRREES